MFNRSKYYCGAKAPVTEIRKINQELEALNQAIDAASNALQRGEDMTQHATTLEAIRRLSDHQLGDSQAVSQPTPFYVYRRQLILVSGPTQQWGVPAFVVTRHTRPKITSVPSEAANAFHKWLLMGTSYDKCHAVAEAANYEFRQMRILD